LKTEFIIFDGITALDFISVYNPVSQLKSADFMSDFSWKRCSFSPEVAKEVQLQSTAKQVRKSLLNHDLIVVVGSFLRQKNQKSLLPISWLEIYKRALKNDIGVYRLFITGK
jgi:cyclohexyl-isocyanide hydratase